MLSHVRRGAASVPLGRPTAARLGTLPPRRGIGAPDADEDDLPPLMLAVAGQGISVVRGMLEVGRSVVPVVALLTCEQGRPVASGV